MCLNTLGREFGDELIVRTTTTKSKQNKGYLLQRRQKAEQGRKRKQYCTTHL